MIGARVIACCVACLLVGAIAFGAGVGTVAVFSDAETIEGSFSAGTGADHTPGSFGATGMPTENASENGSTEEDSVVGNDSDGNSSDLGGNASTNEDPATNDGNASEGNVRNETGSGGPATPPSENGTVDENDSVETGGNGSAAPGGDGNGSANDGNRSADGGGNGSENHHGNVSADDGGNHTAGPTDDPSASLSVTAASVDARTVTPNRSVTATATVENEGAVAGTTDVALTVAGTTTDSATVDVQANGARTVSFTHSFDEEGTYAVAIDGVDAGTVAVVPQNGDGTNAGSG